LPILLVIFLIGLLAIAVPSLRRFYPVISRIFLFSLAGYVIGVLVSVIFIIGMSLLSNSLSILQSDFAQAIRTLVAFIMVTSPIAIPLLGAIAGSILAVKNRKQ
jgi:hypothetical protein